MLDMKTLEDEWYVAGRLKVYRFRDLRVLCIIIYCMSALSLHIECTDPMLPQVFVLMNFYILMRYVLCSTCINGVGHHWE